MKTKTSVILTLFLALAVQLSYAQEKEISGTISDQNGVPLIGVNIFEKDTSNGTQSDFDGNYKLNAEVGKTIVFSSLGYKTVEQTVGDTNTINVTMPEEAGQLDEIVVTALGVKRKQENITYANEVVKGDQVNQAANSNAIQALAGKVSGLQINTSGSGVNPNKSIILRGFSSISGGNSALVVIDDVISTTATLNNIDPNSIESVNVLKGPVGAALYGSRAGNGVIIVTTKKGSKGGKLIVDLKSTLSIETIQFLPQRQDRFGQGWEGDLDWTDQGAWGPEFDGSSQVTGIPYPTASDWRFARYEHIEDNIKPFFDTGVEKQQSITLSAGNSEGYGNFSYNFVETEGLIPGDRRTRNFFNFSAGKTLGKFNIKGIARYTTTKSDIVTGGTYFNLSQTPTNIDVTQFASGDNVDNWTLYARSPYWNLKNSRALGNTARFEGNLDLGYDINDNINVILRTSVNTTRGDSSAYNNDFVDTNMYQFFDRSIVSSYSSTRNGFQQLYTDLLTNLNYDLSENISFNGLLGYNMTATKSDSGTISGTELTIPGLYNIGNAAELNDPTETRSVLRGQSVFASAEFGYKNYLTVLFTGRNDWFSQLSKAERSIFYPSASFSFIPTKAFPSIKSKWLTSAIIRGGWTQVANVGGVGAFAINERAFSPNGFPFSGAGNSFIGVTSLTDENITPEVVTTYELVGNFDLLRVNGRPRINLDLAYSFQTNKDQILGTTPSSSSGLFNATVNVGETETSSFELDLGFTPIKTENFEWNARIGYSTYETRVNKVTDISESVTTASTGTVGIVAQVGEAWPSIQGTAYQRDDQGRVIIDDNGSPIRSNDLEILGKIAPDYILNFNTSVKYKGFTLGATLDYRTGHVFHSGVARNLNGIGGTVESAINGREPFVFPNSTVQGSGVTNTTVLTGGASPAAFQSYVTDNYGYFDENFIIDATALKIREVALSYDLNQETLKQLGLNKLSLAIAGRNLYTFLPRANRSYNDPEFGGGLGFYSVTPPTRSFALSLNVAF